ncbi:RHS repeat-associated core domain-containing protein [Pseudomonas sp. OA65]|uniref:RHS repeat-associated core domain-containing protein n=1 Tax=Pseudomonas sp. OA65 TaxID=2818431 RepID=UPI001A9DCBBC|nr:RHS repeat-associated core domain-containing protein [Pseudomonas sp. OA65]MBO1540932.1 RHS repeat-associated core domain-containing protein [Pseudomonas sp. OA65]
MAPRRNTELCHYYYDPLDRLVSTAFQKQITLQRFYCKNRLTTEIQNQVEHSIFQQGDQLLAQQCQGLETALLATDQQRSVLLALRAQPHGIAYLPYGHRPFSNGLMSVLGFNGERSDSVTGHYLLGNGHRAFSPVLMRFNSPDSLSPFGKGGFNSYAYCHGDPVNFRDPTGQFAGALINAFRIYKTVAKRTWKLYATFLRPRPAGLQTLAKNTNKAGYTLLAMGEIAQATGYPAGVYASNTGTVLLGLGSTIKTTQKLFKIVRSSELAGTAKRKIIDLVGGSRTSAPPLIEVTVVPRSHSSTAPAPSHLTQSAIEVRQTKP